MEMTCAGDSLVSTSKLTRAIRVFRPPPSASQSAKLRQRQFTALLSRCSATSNPTTLGQILYIQDTFGFLLEQHQVQLVNETPGGRQIPQWRSQAFPGGHYTTPFTIAGNGFALTDRWTFTVPSRIDLGL
jgi:hypothetical protein